MLGKNILPEPGVLRLSAEPTVRGTYTYTGQEQSLALNNYDSRFIDLDGTLAATNAGTYPVTMTLKPGYSWPDGSTSQRTLYWTISKATGSLSVNKTSVTLDNANPTATINITQVGDGAITVTSSNPSIVNATLDGAKINLGGGENGSTKVTISAVESTNYTKPQSVTVNVTVDMLPRSLKDCTPAQIKRAVDSGKFAELYSVGDLTTLVPLNGTMGGVTFSNYKVRFRIMHIQSGHPIFMLATNENGVEVALTSANYGSTGINANETGICMNRKGQIGDTIDSTLDTEAKSMGPNKKGWAGSYCRGTLMVQFKDLLPAEWQGIIIPTTVWTDNVGNNTNAAANLTSTTDDCFLPDEYELFGTNAYGNQYCNRKQVQWDYPKAGNSLRAFRHDAPTTAALWFERGPHRSRTGVFCGVKADGTAFYAIAAYPYGLRPAFRV